MPYDAINTHSQAYQPYDNLYVHTGDQYRDWYHEKHGIEIQSGFVLPVNRDFLVQLHYGALWGQLIIYLLLELGIKGNTHEL